MEYPQIDYPLGPLRRAVLDHLFKMREPQSVAQILAVMPVGTTRGSGESAIKREFDAGRIERVTPGMYVLVANPVCKGEERRRIAQSSADLRLADRLRKREERRRDRERAKTRKIECDFSAYRMADETAIPKPSIEPGQVALFNDAGVIIPAVVVALCKGDTLKLRTYRGIVTAEFDHLLRHNSWCLVYPLFYSNRGMNSSTTKKCVTCGKDFVGQGKRLTCSPECTEVRGKQRYRHNRLQFLALQELGVFEKFKDTYPQSWSEKSPDPFRNGSND